MKDKTRVYGSWAGKPEGFPEDPERCVAEVWHEIVFGFRQCGRFRGHGPDGLYCKQHGKMEDSKNV